MIGTPLRVMVPDDRLLPKFTAVPMAPDFKTHWKPVLLLLLLLSVWISFPVYIHQADPTAGTVDQSIWMLVTLSLIVFLLILALCWWLLQLYWKLLDLPQLYSIVSQFNTLTLWQQLLFFWLSFVSLLLAALGCLASIC